MDRWFQIARLWLRSRLLPGHVARDLDHELFFHLEQQTAEFMASGLSRDQALNAAHERLGDVGTIKRRTNAAADQALQESLDEWRSATMLPRRINLLAVVLTFVVLGAIGGFAIGKTTKPEFRAQAELMVTPPQVTTDTVSAEYFQSSQLQTTQVRVLSRTRLERLVIEFNLYEAERKTGIIMEDVVETMRSHIDIMPTGRTFAIRYTGQDPTTVMRVTEQLASYFKDDFIAQDERVSSNTMRFLEAQVDETGRRLSDQQARAKAAGTSDDRRVKLEAAVLESTYTRLLTNLEEARGRLNVTRTMSGPQLVLVDAARKPERPITPSVLQQTWVGALGGLATGIAIALIVFGIRMWRGRPPASPLPELAGR